jgi:hypothetical protein
MRNDVLEPGRVSPGRREVSVWSSFVGRALQLFGLVLVTRAVFMSSGSQLRAMLALTATGAAFFVVGWQLARNDPESRR